MRFEEPVTHHVEEAPERFLEKLKEATIPFESIFDPGNPVGGYAEGLKQSFVGDTTIVARITGNEARLMPIGLWPVKGKSATPNVGYLRCVVEPADHGLQIDARYVLPWFYRLAIPAFAGGIILLVIAIILLAVLGENLEGRFMMMGMAAFMCFVIAMFTFAILRGAKTQAKLSHRFLADFVDHDK